MASLANCWVHVQQPFVKADYVKYNMQQNCLLKNPFDLIIKNFIFHYNTFILTNVVLLQNFSSDGLNFIQNPVFHLEKGNGIKS